MRIDRQYATSRDLRGIQLFDPVEGVTVIEPPGSGPGWWAGACSALHDEDSAAYYLYYRIRRPRELGRGTDCFVARSEDGVRFETIWHARKEDFGSESVERGCLVKMPEGPWRLYLSYVDPADRRWRTDAMTASSPDGFRTDSRVCVFTAADIGAEGVKDPVITRIDDTYCGLFSYAPAVDTPDSAAASEMHATGDVYNSGITRSHTGLAESEDGIRFQWLGDVLSPRAGEWDGYCARIACLLRRPPLWVAFYDGSASVQGNYEERTGLAAGADLRKFTSISPDGPAVAAPHGSGSLRYMDVVEGPDRTLCYYEYARPDGSHELRLSRLP